MFLTPHSNCRQAGNGADAENGRALTRRDNADDADNADNDMMKIMQIMI